MAITAKMTYDDLDCLLDDDGNRYEIIDGEVVVSPQPLLIHQWASGELHRRLSNYVTRRKLGRVFSSPTIEVFVPDGTTYASQGISDGSAFVPSQVLPSLRLRVAPLFPPM